MLSLRRGTVISAEPLEVEIEGERRSAWADEGMVGEVREGDDVVVNTAALDLKLGSGGFDVVHVNLTRGLEGEGPAGAHVMKLNYTSLQHAVDLAETPSLQRPSNSGTNRSGAEGVAPLLVIPLHGHLAPAAWAAHERRPGLKVGYVQTPGGALPGSLSRDVAALRERDLVAGHMTAAAAYGGELEAISLSGGLDSAARAQGWDAVIAGPGPGILGSETRLGHGGMAALDTAHGGLAVGLPVLVAPRLSSSDPRPRHRGLSHHSRAVLELVLAPVRVPVPEAAVEGWPLLAEDAPEGGSAQAALDSLIEACSGRHDIAVEQIDLGGYAASGLPSRTMGREIGEDPLFFAAPLAAGAALAEAIGGPEA